MVSYLAQRIANVLLRGLAMVSRFALLFVLAKLLEPTEVGLFGLFFATVSFSVLVVGGDFYSYSQRELISLPRERWSFVLQHQALAIGILYFLLIPPQLLLFKFDLLPSRFLLWFFPLLVTEHLAQEINRLLVAMQRPLIASAVFFLRVGVWVWILLPIMWLTPELQSLEAVLVAWMVGSLTAVMIGLIIILREVAPWRRWPVDSAWVKRGFAVGLMFLIATISFKALFTVDRYAVEYLAGPELLGVYVLYAGIAMTVINVLESAVFTFLFPRMISAYRQKDSEGYKGAIRELLWSTIVVSLILISMLVLLAPFVLQWVGRSVYLEQYPMLSLLLAVSFVYALGMIPHYGLYAKGLDRPIVVAHVSSLFVFTVVTLVIAPFARFESVACGLLAAFIWMGSIKLIYYRKSALLPVEIEDAYDGGKA